MDDLEHKVYALIAEMAVQLDSQATAPSVTAVTPLIGDNGILDSMALVEVCMALEDLADEIGFVFDWTSESAMSVRRGMFRTAGSLAEAFATQRRAAGA